MKSNRLQRTLGLAAIMLLIFSGATDSVLAQNDKLFYRGDFDDRKVKAPNGAIVNEDYLKFLQGEGLADTNVVKVRDGVHTIVGYSISNYTFIEGKTGLIAFDTGNNVGMGRETLAMIRKITKKPIVAIIYSHHHYTGGARVYVEDGGGKEVKVYGHPDLERNLLASTGGLGPMQWRRAGIQLGFYLPHEGPDAVLGPAEPSFDDPKLAASSHVPVNRPVKDGEEVVVDGLKAIFYHAVADTADSLIVYFPELDLVLHNTAITPMAFSLYTLRGDYYREPTAMIASIDKVREIRPKYMIGCHGAPVQDREKAYEIATAHRDAYAFIYNQSIRAINRGMTPDEMAGAIRLPKHLDQHPWLFPAYVDNEYNVRGQYRGMVGWYAEDTADLHPPTVKEMGSVMIEGFGGAEKVINRAQTAFKEKKYNLCAKLLSCVLAVEPENQKARKLKADALRSMAQTTRSGIQTRNFLLTHALHIEGKLDWTKPPKASFLGTPTTENILATPPGTYLKLLETYIDPEKSAAVQNVVKITFSDIRKSWALHIRLGVAEVTPVIPNKVDATIILPRLTWAQIVLRQTTLDEALKSKKATIEGDKKALASVVSSFDKVSTAKPDPYDLSLQ